MAPVLPAAGADAMMEVAVQQAHRAVSELP